MSPDGPVRRTLYGNDSLRRTAHRFPRSGRDELSRMTSPF
jgi:hypothetical protein